jgi:hypothetical protein
VLNKCSKELVILKSPYNGSCPYCTRNALSINTAPRPDGTVYNSLQFRSYSPGAPLQLKDGYYCPSTPTQTRATFDAFVYESDCETATTVKMYTARQKHDAPKDGFQWLKELGVKKIRCIVMVPPRSGDIPSPDEWADSWSPFIAEKHLLTLDALRTTSSK